MKIDARLGDNDWRLFFKVCPIILLDGVRLDRVVEVDDEAGFVVVEELEDGKTFLRGGVIACKTLTGKVELVVPAEAVRRR